MFRAEFPGAASLSARMLRESTAPRLLVERARATPDAIVLRSKDLGLYRERSFAQLAAMVARCASALRALGVRKGDRVAIMGDPCEEWIVTDLAAQAAGAIVYGIYPTASQAEVEYQMLDGAACIFVAENQEYVDRILPIADRLPELRRIVVVDTDAMFAYDDARLLPYRELVDGSRGDLGTLSSMAATLHGADPAFIVYTSGTTGDPKGALVTHGAHLAGAFGLVEHYPLLAQGEQRTVIYLPLCHVLGRDVAITLPLMSSLVAHIGESLDEMPTTMFEVAPTVLFTVPRYLQKFASQVLVALGSTSPLKRACYDLAMRVGRRQARTRWEQGPQASQALSYRLARAAVFGPVLSKLGFDRLRLVVSGGAPLPPETMALWQVWGVNVVEMYGQTETAGAIIAGQTGPFPRPGDVGTPPPGVEIALGGNDEILVRSPDLFAGYWRNDDATRAAFDEQGRLRTGDTGAWIDGRLRIVDRVRDFIVTAGGKTISPSYVENLVRGSPYVAEIAVFGHARKYLCALVEIDFDTVSDWARARGIPYTGFTSLAHHPQVQQLLQAEIDRANAQLARVEQIKRFRVLPKALDPEEEGEPVTPTRKVKRRQMYERFRALVESMYDEHEEALIADSTAGLAG